MKTFTLNEAESKENKISAIFHFDKNKKKFKWIVKF